MATGWFVSVASLSLLAAFLGYQRQSIVLGIVSVALMPVAFVGSFLIIDWLNPLSPIEATSLLVLPHTFWISI